MSVVSELRDEQRRLSVGDKVVVYVPWQEPVDWRPYWEGEIVKISANQGTPLGTNRCYHVERNHDGDPQMFHYSYVFPERFRDRVRYVGKSQRLRVS